MSQDPKPDYEPPSVEEVNTDDAPAVTAAGDTSRPLSDLRLKSSLRPLGGAIIRSSRGAADQG
jgi:hypothetical protein